MIKNSKKDLIEECELLDQEYFWAGLAQDLNNDDIEEVEYSINRCQEIVDDIRCYIEKGCKRKEKNNE